MPLGLLAGLALTTLFSQSATQANPAQYPPPSQVEDIVVLGQRSIEEQARDYVATVGAPPGRRRLATWDRRICISVMGLDARYAQFLVDRISAVAASVGLEPGAPGCKPEVLIAFSRDPDGVAQAWVGRDVDAFMPSRSGQTDLGAASLDRFKFSDAPIRWWHVSLSVNSWTGLPVTRTMTNDDVTNMVLTPSRLQSPTRESIKCAFVVVDATQINDVSFGSLSDYLAFMALAQVSSEEDMAGFDTVLNLFVTKPLARLSDWDFDYLQALYSQRTNPYRASTQLRDLAGALEHRRTGGAPPSRPIPLED